MGIGSFFGFGRGKIGIELENTQFRAGDTIKGKVVLNLKKPLKGKELSVTFYGQKTTKSYSGGKEERRTEKIFEFKSVICGEKDYLVGEERKDFQIIIPNNLNSNTMPDGALGNIVKAAQMFSNTSSSVKWYLKARLDVPSAIDMTKEVQINIA